MFSSFARRVIARETVIPAAALDLPSLVAISSAVYPSSMRQTMTCRSAGSQLAQRLQKPVELLAHDGRLQRGRRPVCGSDSTTASGPASLRSANQVANPIDDRLAQVGLQAADGPMLEALDAPEGSQEHVLDDVFGVGVAARVAWAVARAPSAGPAAARARSGSARPLRRRPAPARGRAASNRLTDRLQAAASRIRSAAVTFSTLATRGNGRQ